jgi:hypothetical protein
MTTEVITGCLAGAQFAFRCDAPDLSGYARTHLAPLVVGDTGPPAVTATVRWHDGQPPADRALFSSELPRMERVDRDVYANAEMLWWFRVDDLRDLYLRFTWKNSRLEVEGDFYYRLGNSRGSDRVRRLRHWRRRHLLRQRRFTTLLYYLVYYPCWWWLEETQDLHPIHAAGVRLDSSVVLLGGASGVGKSTLAVALATLPGASLLSDSFVLHNGVEVCAVHEPVLLNSWSRRWLGDQADDLQPIEWRYSLNRRGYHLPPDHLAPQGRCGLLLFPRRAPEVYVRRISSEQAHQRLSASDLIINDLRRYWAYAAILEQLVPGGLMARREAHIGKLAADVPCYELGIAPDATRAVVCETIMRLLPDQRLRVVGKRQ